jgi:hypothetical protein
MKNLFAIAFSVICLAGCGGGDDQQSPQVIASLVNSVDLSAVPSGSGQWTVSYPDVRQIATACYASATLLTFTNVQADGHSHLIVDGKDVGDPATIFAALPACPAP